MAKGQQKSNREAKKPKKTATEKAKAGASPAGLQNLRSDYKDPPKKS